ncbi:MAG: YybS family protein [Candidatus Desulfatibia sp.]|uniref:YybS family protein n=1 Tax=Candidatus Desulfatibia sp. TaxID=3101189 RepID=UPI002F2F4214
MSQGDSSKDILSGLTITTLIFAVAVYMPIIGFISALLIPLPTLFYRSKLGRITGAVLPVLATILMVVILGGISIDILFFFELLMLGYILSELFEMDLSVEKTMLYACGSVLLAGILCLLFYSKIADTGVIPLVSEYVAKNLELTLALYENMGVSEETVDKISASLENIQYVLIRIIPAIVTASTFFVSWTCLLLAKPMLKSRELFYPAFGALNLWKAPEFLIWGLIGSSVLLILPHKNFKIVGLNGLLILMTIYFFQGIAIVSFYFEKKQFPRMLRFFAYTLIALQQVVLLIVIGFGIFDMWLDFRKLGINKEK